MMELDYPPDVDLVKVKAEPVDWVDANSQDLEAIFTGNDTKAKDEEQIIELSFSRNGSSVPNPERPRKRQRVIVLVPTLAEVWNRKKKSVDDEDVEKKLKKLFKPKKETDLSLDKKILASRLKPIGLDPFKVDLPRAEVNQMVTRFFMSSIYGGSMQAAFPKIGAKKLAEHGMDDFMYLHLKYHPYAPQCPGGGGLWFSPEWYGEPWQGVHRVFTRDWVFSIWQYMGQYEVKTTASLTLAEWLGLGSIRYNWAREIYAKDWGSGVCARIQARKDVGPGREPTREEVMAVLRSGRWENTTLEEVRIAFDCGKEIMGVWTMKCIEYDYRFQLELCDKYPNWTPPEKSEPKGKGKRSKKIKEDDVKVEVKAEDGKLPPAKVPRGKKRKRTATPESETSSEDGIIPWIKEEAEVMDDEEQALLNIRSRGTKSRPILL